MCEQPVDLTVLYPTLLELSGLPADKEADGVSVVPLLQNPKAKWERPAIMTYQKGNHAIRSSRWRYIRYSDGSEELYDHESDPNEWNNLANDPQHKKVIANHRKWIPEQEAKTVPDLKNK